MTGWAPMRITVIPVEKPGKRYWRIDLTFVAGPHEGRTLPWADVLMRTGSAKPMARRKLHGLLGRSVPAKEWDRMQPWEINQRTGWFYISQVPGRDTLYHWGVDGKDENGVGLSYLGWQGEDFYSLEGWHPDAPEFEAAIAGVHGFDDLAF